MRKHLLRGGSLVAALLLWQLLTSLHVDFWLHFDRLPTVVDMAKDLGSLRSRCLRFSGR